MNQTNRILFSLKQNYELTPLIKIENFNIKIINMNFIITEYITVF
jgi:hypothetical protein